MSFVSLENAKKTSVARLPQTMVRAAFERVGREHSKSQTEAGENIAKEMTRTARNPVDPDAGLKYQAVDIIKEVIKQVIETLQEKKD